MTIKKVRPGADVEITARDWNAIADAVNWVRAQQGGLGRGAVTPEIPQTGIILVRNDTGETRDRFELVGVGDPVLSPTSAQFKSQLVFAGDEIDADLHANSFGVLRQPLRPGRFGEAIIHGLTLCRLNVTSPGHEYAEVVDGDHATLHSADDGGARILWKNGIEGEVWAMVQLGAASNVTLSRGVLADTLTNSGTADLALQRWDGSEWVSAERTVTVRVGLPIEADDPIADGKVCWAVRQAGHWFVIAAECG